MKVVHWGMGISRWMILCDDSYGHHTAYIGMHKVVLFQKVCLRLTGQDNLVQAPTEAALLVPSTLFVLRSRHRVRLDE